MGSTVKFLILLLSTVLAVALATVMCSPVEAGVTNLTFEWDSYDPIATQVLIYQRDIDGQYDYNTPAAIVGMPAYEATIEGIPNGSYAWVARCRDAQGNVSVDSNEVTKVLDAPLGTIQNFRIRIQP